MTLPVTRGKKQASSYNHLSYFNRIVAPGYKQHRFHRLRGWEEQYGSNTREYRVLQAMKDGSVYSLVVVDKPATRVVGPNEGVVHPADIVMGQKGPALFATGGFFIHLPHYFKPKGEKPYGEEHLHWTVGETSLTPNWVPVDPAYADLMKKRVMSDGSCFTSGPTLNEELDMSPPHFSRAATSLGRFQYEAYDDRGNVFRNPSADDLQTFDKTYQDKEQALARGDNVGPSLDIDAENLKAVAREPKRYQGGRIKLAAQAPAHRNIRTPWAFVPANLSHGSQPNERSGVIRHPSGPFTSHAYNSLRDQGLHFNEFRSLMTAGTEYLNLSFDDIPPDEVWANDGGASTFQIFLHENGEMELLASGGQEVQSYPIEMQATTMRDVPHTVMIETLALKQ